VATLQVQKLRHKLIAPFSKTFTIVTRFHQSKQPLPAISQRNLLITVVEPKTIIIDSLLKSKCFLSRRGAENPLSFSGRSSASGNDMNGQVHRAQLGAIVRLIAAEHGKQSMQQFPHDCHHRLQPSFAASE
jgi:hypothetical protein